MAGAAGFTRFHLLHTDLGFVFGNAEDRRVALPAFVQACVRLVAEFDFAGILDYKRDVFDWVAFAAGRKREGGLAGFLVAVAGTAGLAAFHLLHSYSGGASGSAEYFRMAFTATVHLGMNLVAEWHITGILGGESQLFDGVAFAAGRQGERFSAFIIVAGAAGFALFHLGHGDVLIGAGRENRWMAGRAILEACQVDLVAEAGGTGSLHLVGDFLYQMAAGALLQFESAAAIMAGAAGFALIHVGHRVMDALLFHLEYCVVARLAIVLYARFLQMLFVTEDYLTCIFGVIRDITQVNCMCCYRHSQAGQDYSYEGTCLHQCLPDFM